MNSGWVARWMDVVRCNSSEIGASQVLRLMGYLLTDLCIEDS